MSKYAGKFIYEIRPDDVGKVAIRLIDCPTCGHKRNLYLADLLGRIQRQDIGKHIHEIDGVLQIESNEKRDKRLTHHKK